MVLFCKQSCQQSSISGLVLPENHGPMSSSNIMSKVSDINLHPRTHLKTQNKFVFEC